MDFTINKAGQRLLTQMAREEGVSEEVILRRALGSYKYLKENVFRQGKKLAVFKDDTVETIIDDQPPGTGCDS